MKIEVFEHDLPENLVSFFCNEKFIGVDCETSAVDDKGNLLSYKNGTAGTRGLDPKTSVLSILQLSDEKGDYVVFVRRPDKNSVNLKQVLTFTENIKIIHYAIFDDKFIYSKLGYHVTNMFCTRTLAKLVLPPDVSSSLINLSQKFFSLDFKSKDGQKFLFSIDHWEGELTEEQLNYAAMDVAILGKLKDKLIEMADNVKLKYFYSVMKFVPLSVEIHMDDIYFRLGVLHVDDVFGSNRNWKEYRSA